MLQSQNVPLSLDQNQELLGFALTDQVYRGPLHYTPISTLQELRKRNVDVFDSNEGFSTAYDCVNYRDPVAVVSGDPSRLIYRLDFSYQGRLQTAFFYAKAVPVCGVNRSAALVIPGSGINQSSAIVDADASNHHYGILAALGDVNDVFIYIKPNEDYLAFHDGTGKKANVYSTVNWHLNRGGSLSTAYIVQSLAVMKWLNACYSRRTVVAGLSQGGAAALINAFQSKPKIAIIMAGASVIFDDFEASSHNQIIGVPGYAENLQRVDGLRMNVSSSAITSFLFGYGARDSDFYKIEAADGVTASALTGLSNVQVVTHAGGHSYPVSEIRSYLASRL